MKKYFLIINVSIFKTAGNFETNNSNIKNYELEMQNLTSFYNSNFNKED